MANRVKAYPSNGTRSAADQVAAGAVIPRKFTKAWFRANGIKGGKARARNLTAAELTAIAQLGVAAKRKKRLQKGE